MKKILLSILIAGTLLANPLAENSSAVAFFRKPIWEDIDGETKSLSSVITGKGLIVISYTECKTICPTITSTVKSISEKLELKGKKYEVVFISIDPAADTLEKRKKHFEKFSINSAHWHFLKTDLEKTMTVAKTLGFSFGEKKIMNT